MAISVAVEERQKENQRLREEIERKHGKSVDELRAERTRRVRAAMECRVPDRVPVTVGTGVFACKYAGLPVSAMYYDHAAYREACKKVTLDFEPDTGGATATTNSGVINELLQPKHQRWPGGTLPADVPYQFVEGEYMKPEEYDLFLNDPSDFILRYYLPRIYGTLEPLAKLPPFHNNIGGGLNTIIGLFIRPEFKEIAEKLTRAAEEQQRLARESAEFAAEMASLGFGTQPARGGGGDVTAAFGVIGGGSVGGAPFDAISDHLRGMRGTMLDMYRCPDKLLAACDMILQWRLARATPAPPDPKTSGLPPRGGSPLHRGSDEFMSLEQFEKFYWPGLRKATEVSIQLGYIVGHFFEGVWDDRLEYLLEFPKGKIIFHCERTDVFRAKEILGGHACIQGGVPPSILQTGSPQDVEEYCKKLIKVVGRDGGYILGAGSVIDYAKPENIKAMVDSAKKYGWY